MNWLQKSSIKFTGLILRIFSYLLFIIVQIKLILKGENKMNAELSEAIIAVAVSLVSLFGGLLGAYLHQLTKRIKEKDNMILEHKKKEEICDLNHYGSSHEGEKPKELHNRLKDMEAKINHLHKNAIFKEKE